MNGTRDYYGGTNDQNTGLRYRLDPNEIIERTVDAFQGIERDRYKREVKRGFPLMNEEGVNRSRSLLQGMITKITPLSKYENEERINRQMRHYLRTWIYEVTRNRKRWGIAPENKHMIIAIFEKNIHESMLRANAGFEAELTGKAWNVNENIDTGVQQQSMPQPGGQGLFSWGRR